MKKEFLEPETQVLFLNEDKVVCDSKTDNPDQGAGNVFPPQNGSLDNKF